MNDIRNALKKAGLVAKQEEKRFRHEERVRKKQLGREGLEAERQHQHEEHEQRKAQQTAEVQAAQQAREQREQQRVAERKVLADLKTRVIRGTSGPRRFHYRDRHGYLPYLSISPEVSRRLEGGEYSLVEPPGEAGRVLVVPREVGHKLRQTHPDCVLHLPGG